MTDKLEVHASIGPGLWGDIEEFKRRLKNIEDRLHEIFFVLGNLNQEPLKRINELEAEILRWKK